MGTRQRRLRDANITEEALRPLTGRELDVFLADGSARHGRLISLGDGRLTLEDVNARWYNRRSHRHEIALNQLVEVHWPDYTAY